MLVPAKGVILVSSGSLALTVRGRFFPPTNYGPMSGILPNEYRLCYHHPRVPPSLLVSNGGMYAVVPPIATCICAHFWYLRRTNLRRLIRALLVEVCFDICDSSNIVLTLMEGTGARVADMAHRMVLLFRSMCEEVVVKRCQQ